MAIEIDDSLKETIASLGTMSWLPTSCDTSKECKVNGHRLKHYFTNFREHNMKELDLRDLVYVD